MNFKFVINRIVFTIFMFFFVCTFNFVLFRQMPGDPLSMVAREVSGSKEGRAALEKLYGLDQPMHIQYANYIKSMATFDFGDSFNYRQPVKDILGDKMKNSMTLALPALPIGMVLGILLAVVAASFRGKTADSVITSTSMFIYAIPSFWLSMIMLRIFAVNLELVPVANMYTSGASYASEFDKFKDLLLHLIVPVTSFSLAMFGSYFLVMRSTMIDVFDEDFVLTARAKGLSRKQVIARHVVPNALLPVSTKIVLSLALMFTGAFSIEILFSWPGMGRLMVDSVSRQDYPIMQAGNYLTAMAVVIANFVIDILYGFLDPRVRVSE